MTSRASARLRRSVASIDATTVMLWLIGLLVLVFVVGRVSATLSEGKYGLDTWGYQLVNGAVQGAVYALIALGYTLVYGILFMINFAHGEIFMIGAYAGYFVLDGMGQSGYLESSPIPALLIAFIVGMAASTIMGVLLERIAYRPLRRAPRLVPLISAIGASIFLQQATRLLFGIKIKVYPTVALLSGSWTVGGVIIRQLGMVIVVSAVVLMIALYWLIHRTRFGKAMRAVAEDKDTASLMGIDVDRIIVLTFALGSALAGAAGVMLGLYNRQVIHTMGFLPGLKAFTAAVLGGIGNIPGAMFGGFFLGLVEALAPTALGISTQLKDVIAFSLLVLILIFRPTGLLGEVLSEKKA